MIVGGDDHSISRRLRQNVELNNHQLPLETIRKSTPLPWVEFVYCAASEALVDSARALKLLVLHGCFLTIQGTHSLLYFQPLPTRQIAEQSFAQQERVF